LPLSFRISLGSRTPPDDGMVECVVAAGLFRVASQSLIQASAVPGTVGYWRSANGREVDFMVPRVTDLEQPRLPIEVKGQARAREIGEISGLVLGSHTPDDVADVVGDE
jgi:predicted AAA+ superfamily ATPase